MSVHEIEITVEDLLSLDLEVVLSQCKSLTHYELEAAFKTLDSSRAAQLLSAICSMHLRPENSRVPFSPKFVMENRRGLIPTDFSKESLHALSEYCQFVEVPELKARIADVLWVTKVGKIGFAHTAIEAYLRL